MKTQVRPKEQIAIALNRLRSERRISHLPPAVWLCSAMRPEIGPPFTAMSFAPKRRRARSHPLARAGLRTIAAASEVTRP